jgi:SnoaL-like protein
MKNQISTFRFPFSLALILLASLSTSSAVESLADDNLASDSQRSLAISHAELEFTKLANCFAAGLDALGVGDLEAGTKELNSCFTEDAKFVFEFPPAFQAMNFSNFSAASPSALAKLTLEGFQNFGFVRTQHHVSNVLVEKTGLSTAIMRSYISAVHVFPDESVLNATTRYVDDVQLIHGKWKVKRRHAFVTSITQLPALLLP